MSKRVGMVAERVFNTPLLVERNKASIIGNYMKNRMTGEVADYSPAPELKPEKPEAMRIENIGILSMTGTLVHRGGFMDAESGLLSYQSIRAQLIDLANDDAVKVIVMDVDSCGGEVNGNFELARLIRQVNDEYKPVVAIANGVAFSAAYSLACSAGSFFMIETGAVGSVGVCTQHIDFSEANKKAGIVVTDITAGEGKADFSENHPLSPEARAVLQAKIDNTYEIFVNHVSSMRGIPTDEIKKIGAALIFGENAITLNFVDGILAFDGLIEGLLNVDYPMDLTETKKRISMMFLKNKTEKASTDGAQENDKPEAEVEKDAPVENPVDETKKDATGAEDPAERAAQISEICDKAGLSSFTSKYIRSGMTLDQVKAEVDTNNQIKMVCKLAGKPDKADAFIKSGKSLAAVQKELVDDMEAGQVSTDISNKQDPKKVGEDVQAARNWVLEDAERRQKAEQAKQQGERK